MNQCTFIDSCSFFHTGHKAHSIGEFLLNEYCFGSPDFCAIGIARKERGEEHMPDDLLPHELNKVKNFI